MQDVLSVLDGVSFDFTWNDDILDISLNGRNVLIDPNEEVGALVSVVSVYPEVRAKLSEMQQEYATEQSLVMDGRDIGTVIIPKELTSFC